MADRETIQLILDMASSAKDVKDVADNLRQLLQASKDVGDSYEVLDRRAGSFTVSTDKVDAALDAQVRSALELTQAHKAMGAIFDELPGKTTVATTAVDKLRGEKKPGGNGFLGASYAVQDFIAVLTGGGGLGRALGAASNNISPVLRDLGAGAGIAGAVGLIVTGMAAATPIIEAWWKSLDSERAGSVKFKLEDAAARVKEIQSALDKILSSRPFEERQTAGLVEEFFADSDPKQLVRGLGAALGRSGQGAQETDDDRQRIKHLEGFLGGDDDARVKEKIRNARAEIRRRITEENEKTAAEMLASAPTSAASRRRIRDLGTAFPDGLPRNFAGHLGELEPEAVRRADEEVDDFEKQGERLHEAGVKRRRHAKEARDAEQNKKDLEKEAKALRDKEAKERAAVNHQAAQAQDRADDAAFKRAGEGSLDEEAAARLAQMRAAGGFEDKFGRFHQQGREAQDRQLMKELFGHLGREFPGMAAHTRQSVARQMTTQAGEQIQERYRQAQVKALDSGLDAVGATQQAMMEAVGQLNQLAERAKMLQRNAGEGRRRIRPNANDGIN